MEGRDEIVETETRDEAVIAEEALVCAAICSGFECCLALEELAYTEHTSYWIDMDRSDEIGEKPTPPFGETELSFWQPFRDCLDRTIQAFEIWCGQGHPGRSEEYIDENKAKLVKLKEMK